MTRTATTPTPEPRRRAWHAKRERFETPFARGMQTPARRRALLVALPVVLVGYAALLLALGGGDDGFDQVLYLASVGAWTALVIALLTLTNMAIGGITTIAPHELDERERDQRDHAALRARVVSTAALFVPVVVAPGLARAGEWVAVLALVQSVWFVHCFAPNLLVLWEQRDRAPEPPLRDVLDTEAHA